MTGEPTVGDVVRARWLEAVRAALAALSRPSYHGMLTPAEAALLGFARGALQRLEERLSR